MGISVVGHLCIAAGDIHSHGGRVDRQPAVGNLEGHVLEVIVVIAELLRVQIHVVGARVAFTQAVAAAEVDCALVEQGAVAGCDIAFDAVVIAVVGQLTRVADDGHGHGGPIDRQTAVGDNEGHVLKVVVVILEHRLVQLHVVGARVGITHGGVALVDDQFRVEQGAVAA